MSVRIRVVFNDFPKIAAALRPRAEAIVAKTAHDIEAGAKANVQAHNLIDTGNLLNSIRARRTGVAQWVVAVGADYGIYHEMGTRFLPARPFLSPAAERAKPTFDASMRALLRGVK